MSRIVDGNLGPNTIGESANRWRPRARTRTEFSVARVSEDEIVVLDSGSLHYHTLNQTAFSVWEHCDGINSIEGIALVLYREPVSKSHVAIVKLAVLELREAGLLEASEASADDHPTSRRRLMKIAVAALTGGIVLPVVKSITVPDAALALSNIQNSHPCSPGDSCLSGPTSSGTMGPYCCAYGHSVGNHRCIPVDIAGTSGNAPVGGIAGPWDACA